MVNDRDSYALQIQNNANPEGWNKVYRPGTPKVQPVAEWLLTNPYAGPAKAHDDTDGWVCFPDGFLKIRVTKRPILSDGTEAEGFWAIDSQTHKHLEGTKHGVRYKVSREVFENADRLSDFITTCVAYFIENTDLYLMEDGYTYHVVN